MRMPKIMDHFAIAKGETLMQLRGTGPFEINDIHPAHDPRTRDGKK
jgi:hypothetical protein